MAGGARLRPVWASKVLIHASAPSGRPVLEARLENVETYDFRKQCMSPFSAPWESGDTPHLPGYPLSRRLRQVQARRPGRGASAEARVPGVGPLNVVCVPTSCSVCPHFISQ